MGLFDVFKKKEDAPAEVVAVPETKAGWLSKIRSGLSKTSRILNTDIRDLFKNQGRLVDDAFLEELRGILIKTDMGPARPARSSSEFKPNSAPRRPHGRLAGSRQREVARTVKAGRR
ncbi:MAG: hypothetical protein QM811_12330 [Pirellulales bacterium]